MPLYLTLRLCVKQKIGITDCSKYLNYERWFANILNIEIIKLSHQQNNADLVSQCDGIVLTGGEDVHPKYYKAEYINLLNPAEINEARDAFEWEVLEKAFSGKKPLLGICRGMQFVNVFLGGTLIPDIPSVTGNKEHSKMNGIDQRHSIRVEKNSVLHNATHVTSGEVNSAHHQSVDDAAPDLEVIAHSGSIVEAMQWKHPQKKSWLLLIQWHPERMEDQENPFAGTIQEEFLKVSRKGP